MRFGLLRLIKVAFISGREVAQGDDEIYLRHAIVRIHSRSGARPGIRAPPRSIPFFGPERRHMGRTMVAFTENRDTRERTKE